MLTEYRIDPEAARQKVASLTASLRENRGVSDFRGFALGVIARRLEADPRSYLEYGPYWPALRAVMRNAGHDVGDDEDPAVEGVYCGANPEETIVAADLFRDFARSSRAGRADAWDLSVDPDDGPYIAFDAHMEARAAAVR